MNWEKLLNNNRLRQSRGRDPKDARNDFESDFGRIIFSPALRRMHDKTQVFPLTTDDNIHSRLTHSMEVMSIGQSLGDKLSENEDFQKRTKKSEYDLFREIPIILKNSCLIHDIGNPPFGHFGETVIQNFFKDFFKECILTDNKSKLKPEDNLSEKLILELNEKQKRDFLSFDGNAQGLRIISKLQYLNDIFGLNLTYATLAAYIKYPNYEEIDKDILSKHKVGVFTSEIDAFKEISDNCGLNINGKVNRHPLSYLMEAADSICYLTMDIEDGYAKNLINLEYYYNKLKNIPELNEKIQYIYEDQNNYYKNDTTKIINFRIQIIQKLVLLAVDNFIENLDEIEKGNYNKELIFDDPNKLAETLEGICVDKVFKYREINSLEITGHSVIKGLLEYYIKFLFHENKAYRKRALALISNSILKVAFEESKLYNENAKFENLSDYYKLRVIVDFVSGMTDQYALNHFQKINGQKIS
jgi:dGTPase